MKNLVFLALALVLVVSIFSCSSDDLYSEDELIENNQMKGLTDGDGDNDDDIRIQPPKKD
ncbi:MAG: hypothetical protein ACQESK_00155 [Bacteroidota bacterium]